MVTLAQTQYPPPRAPIYLGSPPYVCHHQNHHTVKVPPGFLVKTHNDCIICSKFSSRLGNHSVTKKALEIFSPFFLLYYSIANNPIDLFQSLVILFLYLIEYSIFYPASLCTQKSVIFHPARCFKLICCVPPWSSPPSSPTN